MSYCNSKSIIRAGVSSLALAIAFSPAALAADRVWVTSTQAQVDVINNETVTSPAEKSYYHGIYVGHTYTGVDADVSVVNNSPISTLGEHSRGLRVDSDAQGGTFNVQNTGQIVTDAYDGAGIDLRMTGGNILVDNSASITTNGQQAPGIRASASFGSPAEPTSITVQNSGDITVRGNNATGIVVTANAGNGSGDLVINNTGDIRIEGIREFEGGWPVGAMPTALLVYNRERAGDVVINTSGDITTRSNNRGVGIFASNTGTGDIRIDASGQIRTGSGENLDSLRLDCQEIKGYCDNTAIQSGTSANGTHTGGNNTVRFSNGSIVVDSNHSHGIYAHTLGNSIGNIDVENSGVIQVNGAASNGIRGLVSGNAENTGTLTITNQNQVDARNSNSVGIYAESSDGAININLTDASSVVGGAHLYGAGVQVASTEKSNGTPTPAEQTITNHGTISAVNGAAVIAHNSRSADTIGTTTLNNFGTIEGSIDLAASFDQLDNDGETVLATVENVDTDVVFNNAGTWRIASQFSDNVAFTNGNVGNFGTENARGMLDNSGSIEIDAGVAAAVFGHVNVNNSGVIAVADKNSMATATEITIDGNYHGAGGLIALNTELNGDASKTDRLIITGDTSGASLVKINNVGGAGAQTVEGIKVIDVAGASDGTFDLAGDTITRDNKVAVVAGAYAYSLEKNGISTPTDGNWYLRSQGYQPGAPVYEAYGQALLDLNGVSSLRQRVGNRVWSGAGNRVIAEGADAIVPYAEPAEAGTAVEGNGVWGRIEGAHNHISTGLSTTGVDYKQDIFRLQAGVDGLLMENEAGKLLGGVTVHYAHGSAKTRSVYDAANGGGEIRTDGYGFGGTLTWYGENGFYVDAQGQLTWYDSDLNFDGGDQMLADGISGFGYALSLEGGKKIALDDVWSVTPQAQLVYSNVKFDDFTDAFGTAVSLDKGDSLQGRLGLTLDHQTSWQNDNGMMNRASVYGIANLYYEFLEGTRVDVDDVSLANRKDRVWGGLGAGGSYNWDNDKYSIYGEGIVNTSLNNFADSYSLKGNIGFRMKW